MNKTEYMEALKKQLHRLPKSDFNTAIDYFEEYFADAGVEREPQVIEDLGSPEFAAEQIITTLALNNAKEPVQNVRKGLNAVWVGILALCAAPIALPLVLVLFCTVLLVFLAVFLVIIMLVVSGIAFTIYGPLCIIGSFTVITKSFPIFIVCMGWGFVSLGLGLLITAGSIWFCKVFLTAIVRLFGGMVRKGGRKS